MIMGSEFGQFNEWHYEHSLDWHLLELDDQEGTRHRALQTFFREANALYLSQPALWENDADPASFQWLCADDCQGSCVAFLRRDLKGKSLVVLCNFSDVYQEAYRLGVPYPGHYRCLLSTEEPRFGGSGPDSREELTTHTVPCHGQAQSLVVDLPPMSALILRCSKRLPPRNGHGIKTELKPD